jgi:hypothetical protein
MLPSSASTTSNLAVTGVSGTVENRACEAGQTAKHEGSRRRTLSLNLVGRESPSRHEPKNGATVHSSVS